MKTCPECGRSHLNDKPTCFDCTPQHGNKYRGIAVFNDDPFRRAWLGDAEQRAADQGRRLDPEAPHDKFEAKERQQRLGRVYIGDDVTKLSEKGQKAIAHGKGLAN